jgi:hypothetical protein
MLHRDCDWRWPESSSETIWYPTMRLFHQNKAGDWTGVMEKIAEELKLLAATVRARPDPARRNHRAVLEGASR